MRVYLYPNHYLPPFAKGNSPSPSQLQTAALLLYCESLTLGRLGFHDELLLPSPLEAMKEGKKGRLGQHRELVRRYFKEGSFKDLRVGELALLNYIRYAQYDYKFLLEYKSLLNAGVVRIESLAKITQEANIDAQARGINDAWKVMTIDSVLAGFLLSLEQMDKWLRSPYQKALVDKTFVDTDGVGLTGLYLRSVVADTKPSLLKNMSQASHGEFLYRSVLLELFTQVLLSSLVNQPLMSFSDAHLLLHHRYQAHVIEVSSVLRERDERTDDSTHSPGGVQVFADVIRELPVLVPRHPDDVLRWRRDYGAELQDFRRLCSEVAEDIGEDANSEDRNRELRQRVLRPLERLRRDTAGGLKEFGGHFVASEAVGALVLLLFESAIVHAFPQLAHWMVGIDASIATALGGAAIHAGIETKRERQSELRHSDVAFVVRVQKERDHRQN
jgi:hypothetical protein